MQLMGTHFPFHQKLSLTKMTPFHKEKVHSFIAMHPHKYIYFILQRLLFYRP